MPTETQRLALEGTWRGLRPTEHVSETVWASESEQYKTDANNQFDAEYVEHDAAFSVFKTPNPSYTLDEQSSHAVRQTLLQEQRHRVGSASEGSRCEDNSWQLEQRGGGIDTGDEFEELSDVEIEEESEEDFASMASFDIVFIGPYGE